MAESPEEAGSSESTEGAEDAVKRRFREALERKRGASDAKSGAGAGRGGPKVRGAHERADHQRQFRRKSG